MGSVWVLTPMGDIKSVTEERAVKLVSSPISLERSEYSRFIFFFAELTTEER